MMTGLNIDMAPFLMWYKMNSHQRRKIKRQWPHVFYIYAESGNTPAYLKWLHQTYGSGKFLPRKKRCWRYKIDYLSYHKYDVIFGASIFFQRKEDYNWSLLRWEGKLG